MKYFQLLLCLVFASHLKAQTDTTWFNKYWEKTSKDSAVYFRPPVEKLSNGLFKVKDYYISTGKMQMDATMKNIDEHVFEDQCLRYDENGFIESESNYFNGKLNGIGKIYWEGTNQLMYKANFANGVYDGERFFYYKNGQMERVETWRNDKFKKWKCFTRNGKDTTCRPDGNVPDFPGGIDKLYEFIAKNTAYPKAIEHLKIKGSVSTIVYFDRTGRVQHVTITKSLHPILDEEAKQCLYKLPNWNKAYNCEGEEIEFERPIDVFFSWKRARSISNL